MTGWPTIVLPLILPLFSFITLRIILLLPKFLFSFLGILSIKIISPSSAQPTKQLRTNSTFDDTTLALKFVLYRFDWLLLLLLLLLIMAVFMVFALLLITNPGLRPPLILWLSEPRKVTTVMR